MNVRDKLYIDIETADRITTSVLKDHYHSIKQQLSDAEEIETMHPEDFKYYTELLPSLKKILEFYGETV